MKTDNTGKQSGFYIDHKDMVKTPVLITMLPIISMLAAILPGIFQKAAGTEIAKLGIVTLVLTGAVTFYVRLYTDCFVGKAFAKTILVIGYLVSICFLLLVPHPEIYSFWMIGGLIVSMLVDNRLGLLMNFNLVFIMGITLDIRIDAVILSLIICLLMSLLAGALSNKSTVIYAVIIILSVHVTLAFVINNFMFGDTSDYNYLYSLFSIFAVLVTAFFFSFLYYAMKASVKQQDFAQEGWNTINDNKKNEQDTDTPDIFETIQNAELMDAQARITLTAAALEISSDEDIQINDFQDTLGLGTSYEVLCDMDNELLRKLKQYSDSLYTHSVFIGELSSLAAREINADELLTKAGGLYHEIGKISGKNYIEEGLKIADEYAFPKELKAILREHNIKFEHPNSVEAAIVMLSDNVVSTLEYIEKSDDHKYSMDKIIENIFQMRMDKGAFDSSGISIKDYKKLRDFYQKEFGKKVQS